MSAAVSLFQPKFRGVPFGVDPWCCGPYIPKTTRLISCGIIFDVLRPIWYDTSTSRIHFVNFAAFTVSMTFNLAQRSSEVVDFCTNEKRVYNFLLDFKSNLGPILPRFRDIFRYPSPIPVKILGCSPWSRSVILGSAKSEHPRHQAAQWGMRVPKLTLITAAPETKSWLRQCQYSRKTAVREQYNWYVDYSPTILLV